MAATQKATDRKAASSRRLSNAISLLKSDHEEVSALFEKYEKGKSRRAPSAKAELAKKICDALTVHAQIEEEIFYPACHQEVEDAEELLAEAKVEHQSLKELIGKIEGEQPGSDEYDAQVKVLGEYVKHHVKEEQGELFPMVRKSDMDLAEVGAQLEARKKELMAELE
ncbi:MAG: hemerythrin domain-containing protein [Flavobacteriaceae bacterium]